MTRLLATLALLAFLAPAQAEPRGKIVTDPEILKLFDTQPEHKPDPIDRDAYHNCMLKYVGQAQTDAAVSAIRQACLHKTRR